MELTKSERDCLEDTRKMAGLSGGTAEDVRAYLLGTDLAKVADLETADLVMLYASAFGWACARICLLAALVDRATMDAPYEGRHRAPAGA